MRGAVALGGLCRDVPPRHLLTLSGYLAIFVRRLTAAVKFIHQRDSVLDRLETTGVITRGIVDALNITGPAARASGVASDTRLDHPYGIYSGLDLVKRTSDKGDVLSRFEVKTAEILDSVAIIQNLIEEI